MGDFHAYDLAKSNGEKYTGVLQAARKIVADEGVSALYKGLLPALMLVSNPAIQFACYEQLSGRLLALRAVQNRKRLARALAKAVQGPERSRPDTLTTCRPPVANVHVLQLPWMLQRSLRQYVPAHLGSRCTSTSFWGPLPKPWQQVCV